MASRGAHKAFTLVKLIGLLAVAGVLASGFLLPYVVGAGIATRDEADKFLTTHCGLQETPVQQKTNIYARDGHTLLASLFDQNRQVIPLASIPVTVRKALIDTEDRRFYSHHGVDVRGMMRALLSDSGGTTQGASTLTQQYVKQVRYYQATTDAQRLDAVKQDLNRKIYEANCALDLEKKYTKDQILAKYFNIAYFGEQSYGIAVAAKTYFATTPAKLTIPQAALLAGLVKNPTQYDPFVNVKAARERRDEVIDNMAAVGDITSAQAATYKQAPVHLAARGAREKQGCIYYNRAVLNGGFFCDYVIGWLEDRGGISLRQLETGGYKIVTSLNASLQNHGQKAIWKAYPASAAATIISPSMDPETGEVLTMMTSKIYDYGLAHQQKQDNRYTVAPIFTNATAGAGSTYKYFSMLAALTAGVTPQQTLTTSAKYYPRNCPQNAEGQKAYTTNAGSYSNTMTMDAALYASSNTWFVGLEDQIFNCDLSTIAPLAERLGVRSLNGPYYDPNTGRPTGKSILKTVVDQHIFNFTLGQTGSSPLEETAAYAVSANDGVGCSPNPVRSITAPGNKPVKFKRPACQQLIDPWVARTILQSMVKDTTQFGGTATSVFGGFYAQHGRDGYLVASKTGTNNAARYNKYTGKYEDNGRNSAIWFVGLTPHFASATTMFNPAATSQTLNIPGVYNSGTDTFGAYAGTYWIKAYGDYVTAQPWSWKSPNDITNGIQVPTQSLIGQSPDVVAAQLKSLGFKPKQYPVLCGSNQPFGQVAYIGPGMAGPKSTVYYCVSNGKRLNAAAPPRKKTRSGNGNGGGNNGGGGQRGNPPRHRGHLWQGTDALL